MAQFDTYRAGLKRATYDWREDHLYSNLRRLRKDRRNGRVEKRSARQQDVREIERIIIDYNASVMDYIREGWEDDDV